MTEVMVMINVNDGDDGAMKNIRYVLIKLSLLLTLLQGSCHYHHNKHQQPTLSLSELVLCFLFIIILIPLQLFFASLSSVQPSYS